MIAYWKGRKEHAIQNDDMEAAVFSRNKGIREHRQKRLERERRRREAKRR